MVRIFDEVERSASSFVENQSLFEVIPYEQYCLPSSCGTRMFLEYGLSFVQLGFFVSVADLLFFRDGFSKSSYKDSAWTVKGVMSVISHFRIPGSVHIKLASGDEYFWCSCPPNFIRHVFVLDLTNPILPHWSGRSIELNDDFSYCQSVYDMQLYLFGFGKDKSKQRKNPPKKLPPPPTPHPPKTK